MRIINPYEGVDFVSIPKIKAISHEHISSAEQLKSCYDRGIRYFASVWYQPAGPHYPYNGWTNTYVTYANADADDFSTTEETRTGSIASFVDKDGNTITTSDLIQLPNAEHPKFAWDKTAPSPSIMQHFNVLGSLWAEVGHGIGQSIMNKIQAHPLWDLNDINEVFTQNLLFPNKVFGTINHNNSLDTAVRLLNTCPGIFKATEINNNGYSYSHNQQFRDVYDQLLSMGYRLWGTSVQDWQGDYRESEVQYDRGCNVLLIDGYESKTNSQKSESGLDAYISGRYYCSGFGNASITKLDVTGNIVTIRFDKSATSITAITNKGKVTQRGSEMTFKIPLGAIYLRFEAFFDDDINAKDFIMTNPMWIEDNVDDTTKRNILILDI